MLIKNLFLLSFFLILLVPVVYSAKVTQVGTGAVGYDIRIPQAEFVKQSQDVELDIHVWNKTNGIPINNDTTGCTLHIFNKTGHHILTEDMDFDMNGIDFELDIGGGNFSELGFNSFLVSCNSTEEGLGGFASGSILVTEDGTAFTSEDEDNRREERLILYFVLILLISLFIVAAWKEDQTLMSLSGIGMIAFGVFIGANGFSTLNNLLSNMLAVVLIGLGAYAFISANMENID